MKLATLLYIKNDYGDYLLLERIKNPNKGLLSPPGGKLDVHLAESPIECAVREANEECGIISENKDWKLIGIISEKEFPHIGNIMVFLFEYKQKINEIPDECAEGKFHFIPESEIMSSNIPETDKKYIWSSILQNNKNLQNEPFFLNMDCTHYPEITLK
jgi:8-oxo-dGTP diphosphatase